MLVEDHTAYLADFGVLVTLGAATVPAIFDNGYTLGAAGPFGMATTGPQLTCATAQIPADPVGLAVTVGGRSYLVAEHQPDGTGMSTLILELAP